MNDFENLMEELQREWHETNECARENYGHRTGIRSTQVAALVSLLLKKGVLKPEADV